MPETQNLLDRGIFARASRIIRNPLRSAYSIWSRLLPNTPFLWRLPFGVWWLLRNDGIGKLIRDGSFEPAEVAFVSRFLQPGMIVLDIGAHHGMYSLLASTRVGPSGKIFAFEPSPRERDALRTHLSLNNSKNVQVQPLAVGEQDVQAGLYVLEAKDAGCNSLRPPTTGGSSTSIPVHVVKLDDWIAQHAVAKVDFIKLDVEGGELGALRGATQFLQGSWRPVLLVEVQDVRTLPWGYRAQEIIKFMQSLSYRWFLIDKNGSVSPLEADQVTFEDNLVACPAERLEALQRNGFPAQ